MPKIDELLYLVVEQGASDLHLSSSYRPAIRHDGEMHFLKNQPPLAHEDVKAIIYEFIPERNKVELEERWDTDFAYALEGAGRFRVNVFMDHHGIGAVCRLIPSKIPSLEELNMPEAIRSFCFLTKGLVIVTGPTGSGKSTTLAAMIDLINRTRRDHIITIEDPIEFLHQAKGCLINQREVNVHTRSFSNALRAALREDPDIVLVGEMRDLETIETAIETAETGHLVFATLHTNSAAATVDRMIDKFPHNRQNQIRTMLADTLIGIVAQTLCKKIYGGRVAATEILVVTPAVASNIRDGKTHQIPSAMQTGKSFGMQMFGECMLKLVQEGIITPQEAYMKTIDKAFMVKKFEEAGIELDLTFNELTINVSPDKADAEPGAKSAGLSDIFDGCRQALARNPNDVNALRDLAWILSTNKQDEARNGGEAVELAERALEHSDPPDAMTYIVLGAAYAEAGRFDEAVDAGRKAYKAAKGARQRELLEEIDKQIMAYKRRQPIRVD